MRARGEDPGPSPALRTHRPVARSRASSPPRRPTAPVRPSAPRLLPADQDRHGRRPEIAPPPLPRPPGPRGSDAHPAPESWPSRSTRGRVSPATADRSAARRAVRGVGRDPCAGWVIIGRPSGASTELDSRAEGARGTRVRIREARWGRPDGGRKVVGPILVSSCHMGGGRVGNREMKEREKKKNQRGGEKKLKRGGRFRSLPACVHDSLGRRGQAQARKQDYLALHSLTLDVLTCLTFEKRERKRKGRKEGGNRVEVMGE